MISNKLLLVLSTALLFQACKKEGCTDVMATNYDNDAKKDDGSCEYAPAPDGRVMLHLHHVVGNMSFAYGTVYQDGSGNDYQFTLAKMYLSNPRYKDMSGTVIHQPSAYAFVEGGVTSQADFGSTIDGHFHSMDFFVGIDSATNHMDPAQYEAGDPLAFAVPSNHWGWSNGYRFVSLEGTVDKDGDGTFETNFAFHIGTDNLRQTHNNLMIHADVEQKTNETIHLEIDWGQFLNGVNLATDTVTHTSNNLPLATSIAGNGVSVISVE